jgi:hypothetical protein
MYRMDNSHFNYFQKLKEENVLGYKNNHNNANEKGPLNESTLEEVVDESMLSNFDKLYEEYTKIISQDDKNRYSIVNQEIKQLDLLTEDGMNRFVVLLSIIVKNKSIIVKNNRYKEVNVKITKEKLENIEKKPNIEKLKEVLSYLTVTATNNESTTNI